MIDYSELTDAELVEIYRACRHEAGKRHLEREKRKQEIKQMQDREEEQEL